MQSTGSGTGRPCQNNLTLRPATPTSRGAPRRWRRGQSVGGGATAPLPRAARWPSRSPPVHQVAAGEAGHWRHGVRASPSRPIRRRRRRGRGLTSPADRTRRRRRSQAGGPAHSPSLRRQRQQPVAQAAPPPTQRARPMPPVRRGAPTPRSLRTSCVSGCPARKREDDSISAGCATRTSAGACAAWSPPFAVDFAGMCAAFADSPNVQCLAARHPMCALQSGLVKRRPKSRRVGSPWVRVGRQLHKV